MPSLTAIAITQAFIEEDLSGVHVHINVLGGSPIVLTMTTGTPRSLGSITNRLTQLHSGLQTRIGATTGHLEIHAPDVQAVTANAPVGGGKVILSIRNKNGLIEEFALSPDQSQELRVEMQNAEASARKQASQPRN